MRSPPLVAVSSSEDAEQILRVALAVFEQRGQRGQRGLRVGGLASSANTTPHPVSDKSLASSTSVTAKAACSRLFCAASSPGRPRAGLRPARVDSASRRKARATAAPSRRRRRRVGACPDRSDPRHHSACDAPIKKKKGPATPHAPLPDATISLCAPDAPPPLRITRGSPRGYRKLPGRENRISSNPLPNHLQVVRKQRAQALQS